MSTSRIDQTEKFWWLSWKWISIAMENFCILLWFFDPEKIRMKSFVVETFCNCGIFWHAVVDIFNQTLKQVFGWKSAYRAVLQAAAIIRKQWKFIQSNLLSRTPQSNCFRLSHQIAHIWHKFHRFNLLENFVASSEMFKTSSRPWNVVTIYQFPTRNLEKSTKRLQRSKSKLSSILSGLRTSNKLWTLEKRTRRKKKVCGCWHQLLSNSSP